MTFTEDEFLPISALQHLAFCERQWALIHLEQIWQENILTVEGKQMHERVHEEDFESRGELRVVRSLRLRSFELGLTGQADVVEFLEDENGTLIVTPVEFKHGKWKMDNCDAVQLCAQAFCLEEMLHINVKEGYFFYGKPRRRHRLAIEEHLREETRTLSQRLHDLYETGYTPPAKYSKKCDNCSLFDVCMPKITDRNKSASQYLNNIISCREDSTQ
jgi:CRISPR-associated exonuclease Cas4